MVLIINKNIEVRKSPIHGYGVFATEDIPAGEILEECHFILFPQIKKITKADPLCAYGFAWPHQTQETLHLNTQLAIPLGTGCVYNSSPNNNAIYTNDLKRQLIIFSAIKPIKKGEEICTDYEASIAANKQEGRTYPGWSFTIE